MARLTIILPQSRDRGQSHRMARPGTGATGKQKIMPGRKTLLPTEDRTPVLLLLLEPQFLATCSWLSLN